MERNTTKQITAKKTTLMSLLLALALMLATATPAVAQEAEQGFEQEAESGDFEAEFSTTNKGDSSNACAPALQFGNTGNLQNEQGVLQDDSTADDIGIGGSTIGMGPELDTECEQEIQQSAAASSSAPKVEEKKAKAAPTAAPKTEAKAGGTEAKAVEAPKAEAKAGAEAKAAPASKAEAGPKELPKTGGSAPLLALGGGLLIGGGLLVRRIFL